MNKRLIKLEREFEEKKYVIHNKNKEIPNFIKHITIDITIKNMSNTFSNKISKKVSFIFKFNSSV